MAIRVRGLCPLLQVFDMPRSLHFYRDILGFSEVEKSGRGDRVGWARLRHGNAKLMLNTAMPETLKVGHMGHPDFRVGGKIFATLGYPDERWGMVKLTPEQQEAFVAADPAVYAPVQGGWGQRGAT